jgi:hypothetical protein
MRKNCAESCNSCEELDRSDDTNNNNDDDNNDDNTRDNDVDRTNTDDVEIHVNDGGVTTRRPRQKYEEDEDDDGNLQSNTLLSNALHVPQYDLILPVCYSLIGQAVYIKECRLSLYNLHEYIPSAGTTFPSFFEI